MSDRELLRYVREAFRYMDRETQHISFEEMAELATGQASEMRAAQVQSHLAACEPCRKRLQEFEQFVKDCEHPTSVDLSGEWRELQRKLRPGGRKVVVMRRWLPAFAAAVIAVVVLSWLGLKMLRASGDPQRLLAEAYRQQRSSEFRLAGADYSPLRQQRGNQSAFSLPQPLLKAEARLAEEIKSDPNAPETLRLQGEAEMMAGNAASAVRTLEKANDLRPQDAHILADLGSAYALRGDAERQFGDYTSALEYLSRSLHQQPQTQEVTFNRALVLERMMLFDQAIQEWQNYLKMDGASEWANEARQHLSDLQKKMKSREDGLQEIQSDPARFLELVNQGHPINAEGYLDIAVIHWLPAMTQNEAAQTAVKRLADNLQSQHSDSWLAGLAASGLRPAERDAWQSLAMARLANQEGHGAEALIAARKAKEGFVRAGSPQGTLWADFEEVYGLKLTSRMSGCVAAAASLDRELEQRSYPWLRARNRIEQAICIMRLGRLEEAGSYLTSAMKMSRKAGFDDGALRATGMYLEVMSNIAPPSEVFHQIEEFLRVFWSGSYPALRFYQVAISFVDFTTSIDQRYVAYFLARSAFWAAGSSHNLLLEAAAREKLAVAALAVGEEAEAHANLAASDPFFVTAPQFASYRLEPEIAFAQLEVERGELEAAAGRLEALQNAMVAPPTVRIGVLYYATLGEAYRQKGMLAAAEESFRKSIGFGTRRVASLASERDRTGALNAMKDSYRGLAATALATPGTSPEQVLHIWQQYRLLDAGREEGDGHQPDAAILSYAELPDGFVGWLVRGQQVTMRRLAVSRQDARTVALRFLRLCSDPTSSPQSWRSDAQQLYEWMIAPFADQLMAAPQEQSLIVEPDGTLAGVPLQTLMSHDGTYLGDRFFILHSLGLKRSLPNSGLVPQGARTLVIANPAVLGESAAQFPSLPDSVKEAEFIRGNFSNTVVIEGRQATIAALLDWLPNVQIVHISGHGYATADNGALLLAPEETQGADYDLLRAAEVSHQNWSGVRLVVLSACATAAGETQGPHNPASLVRALVRAGGSRVTASLWRVDSAATREFMSSFYAALAQSNNPAQALRVAQQSVRRNSEWTHPYYWAGFQLYGTT
jgi:CHAT domain-containing protein/tetratricopeptide (TPR) repeat protein